MDSDFLQQWLEPVWTATGPEGDEVMFEFEKFPVIEGYKVLNKIRVHAGEELLAAVPEKVESLDVFTALVQIVLSLDEAFVEWLRNRLFKQVYFVRSGMMPGRRLLDGKEDMAFEPLTPYHVFECLGRAFVVNFISSFPGLSNLSSGADSSEALDTPSSKPK